MTRTYLARYAPLTVYGRAAYELLRLHAVRGDEDVTWMDMCHALGYAPVGLGSVLDNVRDRCIVNGEPNLSTLVAKADGTPSTAWPDRDEWDAERIRCFNWPWV